jgi:hypothetical protein
MGRFWWRGEGGPTAVRVVRSVKAVEVCWRKVRVQLSLSAPQQFNLATRNLIRFLGSEITDGGGRGACGGSGDCVAGGVGNGGRDSSVAVVVARLPWRRRR